jgi:hypothetical protein
MAGGAGTGLLAGMLDLDPLRQGGITNGGTGFSLEHCPFRADFLVR